MGVFGGGEGVGGAVRVGAVVGSGGGGGWTHLCV